MGVGVRRKGGEDLWSKTSTVSSSPYLMLCVMLARYKPQSPYLCIGCTGTTRVSGWSRSQPRPDYCQGDLCLLLFSVKFLLGHLDATVAVIACLFFLSLSLTGLGFEGEMPLIGLNA